MSHDTHETHDQTTAQDRYTPDNLGESKVHRRSSQAHDSHVPIPVLRYFDVEPGDYLVFEESGGEVVVRKKGTSPDPHLDHPIKEDHRAHRPGEHCSIEERQTLPNFALPAHVDLCPVCFPDGNTLDSTAAIVAGEAVAEGACHIELNKARFVPSHSSAVAKREMCALCFPDGTIPDGVEYVVVGRYAGKVHHRSANEEYAHADPGPDNCVPGSEGLAAKLASDDFGPDDLGLGDGASAKGSD